MTTNAIISRVGISALFSATTSGTGVTLNKPASTGAGDLMVAFVVTEQNSTVACTGWTVKRTLSINDGTTSLALFILMRTFVLGDPASWAGTVSVASIRRYARVVAYHNADIAANQFIVENGATSTADTPTTVTTPVVTNTSSDAWRIACFACHDDAVGILSPGWGFFSPSATELSDDVIGGTTAPILDVSIVDSNGPVGTGTATQSATWSSGWFSSSFDTSAVWIGFIKALPLSVPPVTAQPTTYGIYVDWDNNGSVLAGAPTANEDVTTNALGIRTPLSWSYGRDTERSLSDIQPGSLALELDNTSRIYSPDNAAGALFGSLGPGKEVRVKATQASNVYGLYYGFIDDYTINPARDTKSVQLTVMDALGKYGQTKVTTDLYESCQTGQAINFVLDAVGWPSARRDIDAGATTIRWFWVDDRTALDVFKELIASEGIPAVAYVDPNTGNFVFRDRHHRKLQQQSLNVQATFSDANGSEPTFCAPVSYSIGFKDLINSVSFNVDEREPIAFGQLWNSTDTFFVPQGQTVTFPVKPSDPFFGAITPEQGTDYTLTSGTVSVTLSRTSGQSATISVLGLTDSYVTGMALRGISVPVARSFSILEESQASIDKYGKTSYTQSPPWLNRYDADAIAQIILATRAERLPVMSISVNSGTDLRKVQIYSRTISDRIHINETETGTNHDHYIEKVTHNINSLGLDHRATFFCERVPVPSLQFTFDAAGLGFDDGTFGLSGYDDPTAILILDSAVTGHRLGEGRLAT